MGRRWGGGYVSWDHVLLQFMGMLIGVGGAIVLNIVGICSVLPMMSMWLAYPIGPMVWFCGVYTISECHGFVFGVRFVIMVVLWVCRI